jgi:hypothetical protein
VHASGPTDLLALVPGFLGFHPTDSVVLLTLGDAPTPFHARVDLPDGPVALEELTDYLARVAERHGARTLAVLVYTDDARLAEDLLEDLAGRLERRGGDVLCAVRADGGRWWALGRAGGGPGTPYDLSLHPLTVQAVVDGTVVLGSRRELVDSLRADPAGTAEVQSLVVPAAERLVPATRAQLVVEGRWVGRRVRRALSDRLRLDADDVARLLVLLRTSTELRDVAWAEMTHANARDHVDLWRDVVRRAPEGLRADPAALLGFAAWLSGHGALAWCAVELAQEADPDHGLAALLTTALSAAVPPTAWEPFGRDGLSLFLR